MLHHGIREIRLHGEILSACMVVAIKFGKEFEVIIESEKYEFIYNTDESRLFWRSLS